MNIKSLIGKELLFFDGAMGTMLQANGLGAGDIPEYWTMEKPQIVKDIHKAYLKSGCNIIITNTFGANPIKQSDGKYTTTQLVTKAIDLARQAIEEATVEGFCPDHSFVVLDTSSTGKLLEPLGDLCFEGAVSAYKEMFTAGKDADAILIETMTDTYELKAAVIAAKEITNLPVFTTVMLDEKGKLLTGGDPKALVAMLEGLRVDALGLNCGFGPSQMLPYVKELTQLTSLPLIVMPNAGLPRSEKGETIYDLDPDDFAFEMNELANCGPWLLGGCCGTTPAHMAALVKSRKNKNPKAITKKTQTLISSYTHAVEIGISPLIIGEKINPTGNKSLATAIREKNFEQITTLAVEEKKAGAQILDVNMGLPDIDEEAMLPLAICKLQEIVDSPLVIDCSNTKAIEKAARLYNGKPLINSVSAKFESMNSVFPIVKKYGGVVIGLTLGENGIPSTPKGRLELAKKIVKEAANYGIDKKDIIIDALTMTISASEDAAKTTLESLSLIKKELDVATVLGVSNISFGLPARDQINTTFFAMALNRGLDVSIMNPFSQSMMNTYYAGKALTCHDKDCSEYISAMDGFKNEKSKDSFIDFHSSLRDSITEGLRENAGASAAKLLNTLEPMEIINEHIIPALSQVGDLFETGELFLPQLLMSAEAAGIAFEEVKKKLPIDGREKKGKIILATVKGDIHDIGKNIVKVLLENYDYDVIDLGKDVPPEIVLKIALEQNIKLIGLSALMTTTVPNMAATIELLKKEIPDCKVCVGGAVLTEEYAKTIGAHVYCKDAMAIIKYAEDFFS